MIFHLLVFITLGCIRRGVFDLDAVAHHVALIKRIKIFEIAGFFSRGYSEGLLADLIVNIIILIIAANIRSQVIIVVAVVCSRSDRIIHSVVGVSLVLLFRWWTLVEPRMELFRCGIIEWIHIQSLGAPKGIWMKVSWRGCKWNEIILMWWIRNAVLSTHRVASINHLIAMVNIILRWIRNLWNKCVGGWYNLGWIILNKRCSRIWACSIWRGWRFIVRKLRRRFWLIGSCL